MNTRRRMVALLLGNTCMRLATMVGGTLAGFYLADLARAGQAVDAALLGLLGVVVNGAEFAGALPAGLLADRLSPRALLIAGALLGAAGMQLFGLTTASFLFLLARVLEGLGAAAGGPALLVRLSKDSANAPAVRGRVMSFFQITLLVGLALGGVSGGLLWQGIGRAAFTATAALYALAGILFFFGAPRQTSDRRENRSPLLSGLRSLRWSQAVQRLAPAWLVANALVGLWLTHTSFVLTQPRVGGQLLTGAFNSSQVGSLLLAYALIFSTGVLLWGFLLAYVSPAAVLRLALAAVIPITLFLFGLNHAHGWPTSLRLVLLVLAALGIMVESGFTPAALTLLASATDRSAARGATMGFYTLLLGAGNALGAGLGGLLARSLAFDGLLLGTALLAAAGLVTLWQWPLWVPTGQGGSGSTSPGARAS